MFGKSNRENGDSTMQLIIVTGLSGAGKSQAIDCIEDMGYYCIDNMPPALIKNFTELAGTGNSSIKKEAFVIDVRGGQFFQDAKESIEGLRMQQKDLKLIFLEASPEVLIRRYNETRRQHPLSETGHTADGIAKEIEILSPMKSLADFVIDTSVMKAADLKAEIASIVNGERQAEMFTINFESFGYKYGLPLDADLVLDMRFLPNPFYVPELKQKTGLDKEVRDFVLAAPESEAFISIFIDLIHNLIPSYIREGKYNLNIAFGCTGGHHRSVTMAETFYARLRSDGMRVTLRHRDVKDD